MNLHYFYNETMTNGVARCLNKNCLESKGIKPSGTYVSQKKRLTQNPETYRSYLYYGNHESLGDRCSVI